MAYTLEISPDFTIEDIHKIREHNYEVTKYMTMEEKLLYYNTPRTDAIELACRNFQPLHSLPP